MGCFCRLCEVVRWCHPFIQRDAREIGFIASALCHGLGVAGLATPQQCLLFTAPSEQGQGGTPGTGPNHSDAVGRSAHGAARRVGRMPGARRKASSRGGRFCPTVGSLAGFLVFLLQIHGIEIYRAEQELWKTALGDQAGDGLAQERKQYVRAGRFEHHFVHFRTAALDRENPGLLNFC